jgi:hypothetical protein
VIEIQKFTILEEFSTRSTITFTTGTVIKSSGICQRALQTQIWAVSAKNLVMPFRAKFTGGTNFGGWEKRIPRYRWVDGKQHISPCSWLASFLPFKRCIKSYMNSNWTCRCRRTDNIIRSTHTHER